MKSRDLERSRRHLEEEEQMFSIPVTTTITNNNNGNIVNGKDRKHVLIDNNPNHNNPNHNYNYNHHNYNNHNNNNNNNNNNEMKTTTTTRMKNEEDEYCFNMTGVNIYNLGGRLNCRDNSESFSMSMVLALIFTLTIELCVHHLEQKYRNSVIHLTMLNKIYKELMLMGLIGFFINLMESWNLFEYLFQLSSEIANKMGFHEKETHESEHERVERRILIFDFVHVSLFFLSVAYVVIVALCYYLVRGTWHRWRRYELGTEERAIEYFRHVQKRIKNSNRLSLVFNWRLLWNYSSAIDRLNYFTVRSRFIAINDLKGRPFRFDQYLKHCALQIFVRIIEIDSKMWIICCLAFAINYVRNKVLDFKTVAGGVPLFVILIAGGSLFMSFTVFVLLRTAYSSYIRTHVSKYYRQKQIEKNKDLESTELDSHDAFPQRQYQQQQQQEEEEEEQEEENTGLMAQPNASVNSERTQDYYYTNGQRARFNRQNRTSYQIEQIQLSASNTLAQFENLGDRRIPKFDLYDELSADIDPTDETQILPMNRYFLFRMPNLTFVLAQLALLIQSFYMSLFIIHFVYIIVIENVFSIEVVVLRYIIAMGFMVPTFINVLIMFPLILPLMCILLSVDDRSDQKEISKILRKNEKKRNLKEKKKNEEDQDTQTHLSNVDHDHHHK
jgi:hypothetical protein